MTIPPAQGDISVALPPRYRLVALDVIDSTNEEAKRLARTGAPDGTLVWAQRQDAGRGRRGRAWASPSGNLYCSLLCRPGRPLNDCAAMSFLAAVAVGDALRTFVPSSAEVRLKWPNDVLINGRKVAGILLEAETTPRGVVDWLVVGVGINISSHPEIADYATTSLKAVGVESVSAADMLAAFADRLAFWANQWREEGFGPVRRAWLDRAQGIGKAVTARLPAETVEGHFVGLDDDGALLLDGFDGERRRIMVGDVFFSAS